MPCYDPPPPWEGRARSNAERAVKLMCAMVKKMMLSSPDSISRDLLLWYIEHRKIDIMQSTPPYDYRPGSQKREASARADIALAEDLLSKMSKP